MGALHLIKMRRPERPCRRFCRLRTAFLFLDKKAFPAAFAADVDIEKAEFMADSQVPWGVEALRGMISEPEWRTKPSWYLVVTEDKMIPPDAQRAMSKRAASKVVEIKGSHAIYLSNPEAVTALIEEAVTAQAKAAKPLRRDIQRPGAEPKQ